MLRLNTHSLYDLATRVHPVCELTHTEGMTLGSIFWNLLMARASLRWFASTGSFFSPSLRRAADALLVAIRDVGVADVLPWEATENAEEYDPKRPLESWNITQLAQAAKDFETVLANELPGLAIYYVLQKGIYSTDELITQADHHLPESIREVLPHKSSRDICEAGKCLAFELATASAFHTWRALETVMDAYHLSLTGKSFEDANLTRNWGVYIRALQAANAEKKITSFLDHIRDEYRNPISHPSETLETEEAFSLFSAGLSAIAQAMRATIAERNKKVLAAAAGAALSSKLPDAL